MKSPRSTTRSPEGASPAGRWLSEERAGAIGSLVAATSALALVTCAAGARRAPSEATAQVVAPAAPSVAAPEPSAAPPPPPAAGPKEERATGGLGRFRAALDDLAAKRRAKPVRVLFMGDSHTAADFLPDALRRPLSEKYGSGGPGFVYLGLGVYRHAGVAVARDGKWRVRPKQPSLWMRQDDGVFGLGGIRVFPVDAGSRVSLELAGGAVRGDARFDLSYRLPNDRSELAVSVDGAPPQRLNRTTSAVGAVTHFEWTAPPRAKVVIGGSGEPEIFGVVVESAEPGVVVDNLGINGARIGTPLAWEAEPWITEARRREADLFVLAYGTNEVGDQVAPFRYGPELERLVARVREAAPGADCLVVGPTDRAGPEWTPLARVAEIDAVERASAERAGCVYFSAQAAMGGPGGLRRWADLDPALAATDRVHLTPRGYAELGAGLTALVLGTARNVP